MNADLTIVIPTINSERYLDIVLGFYRDHGFPVTVFVHDQSEDNTLAIAKRSTATVVSISNPRHFVAEGLIEQMSEHCRTKWMLRIDDDELPTLGMMEFVRKAIAEEDAVAYGFARHYDARTPNAGTRWRSYYLYEEQASSGESFAELCLPEFGKTCVEISHRFQDLCPGV